MSTPRLSIAFVQHQVAKAFGIDPRMMTSSQRAKKLARPRQVAMWIVARIMPSLSMPQIGRAFGNRDHTTVIHGVRKIEEMRGNDPAFAELVDGLRLSIVQQVTAQIGADQLAAERMAVCVADAFEVAALTLARTDPEAAMRAFAPLAQALLGGSSLQSEEAMPCG
ncbi:helix-turn-helix domain-containing protein [Paramagnetospirillum magneticum]|uniref:Chromosomal replication initiator DnaA C-terminal domain-containing protein n=1 Tax=Paramagnetospirillum magneticum (strain ATCC 700264 / AMB-1) TaxID=342108 RepID=Q2WA69_PARM1|nr:helix-turn-helix domain-containing protein [Paramagnetospirillum magneticum]BAE49256.1 hypothetical protein amb0452 [Paramagnetospirillum magneticum AMB-1]